MKLYSVISICSVTIPCNRYNYVLELNHVVCTKLFWNYILQSLQLCSGTIPCSLYSYVLELYPVNSTILFLNYTL